jgi:hypothetical protein
MEMRPFWNAASCEAIQELHSILQNPKVCYYVHKSPIGPYSEPDQSSP